MAKSKASIVFFNASVVIAGIHSPTGGSGKLLQWVERERITGTISEIVADEALRHSKKIGMSKTQIEKRLKKTFASILPAPSPSTLNKYKRMVIDHGDAHLLASADEIGADFLVSLDKKHILSLKNTLKNINVISPKELIEKVE